MINLKQKYLDELYKIFHKKTIYVMAIIIIAFSLIGNILFKIFYDEEGNLLITNLVNELSYNFGINSGYYYISDNYNNIEKYYYNTKNEVIYYLKEKNGKIFEKKYQTILPCS
mgnify:CR=1 FL=1